MKKLQVDISEQYRPISAWGYVGYSILFCVPLLGQIILIIFALSGKNINRRNYARSYFCIFLLLIIIPAILWTLMHFNVGNIEATFNNAIHSISQTLDSLQTTWKESIPSNKNLQTSKSNVPHGSLQTNDISNDASQRPSTNPIQTTNIPDRSAQNGHITAPPTSSISDRAGIRQEVKEAIDSYEEFFRQYASFMKKYSSSANSLSMMSDYAKMVAQYADVSTKWERFESDYDLNDAESAYFLAASARINKLLYDAQ